MAGDSLLELLRGAGVTVILAAVTAVGACAVGLVAGLARLSGRPLTRRAGATFVEIFRNVPALILIIVFAFALPTAVPEDTRRTVFFDNPLITDLGDLTGLAVPWYAVAGCLALILNTGAHLAEVFRSGVSALPREQLDSARSLGASPRHVLATVVIPGGIRAAFPAITNRLIHNLKNTALLSFVAVPELFHRTEAEITATFDATSLLLGAAAIYLALSTGLATALAAFERRLRRGRPVVGVTHG